MYRWRSKNKIWWFATAALCSTETSSFSPIPKSLRSPVSESKCPLSPLPSSSSVLFFLDREASAGDRVPTLEGLGIHMPIGLQALLMPAVSSSASTSIRKRIWILDNSGSMALQDGHSLLVTIDKSVECSRWAEVQETVQCHAELASRFHAPTEFRLLNPMSPESNIVGNVLGRDVASRLQVGNSHSRRNQQKDVQRVQKTLSQHHPKGCTPLPDAICLVRQSILDMLPELEASNSRVVLIIATDGSNYNKDTIGNHMNENERQQEVRVALESLQGLPVHVVIRLCTDFAPLVDFYNDLDVALENTSIDVIDDYSHEADQVYLHNPWLNYALPLHRLREMGQVSDLWDRLDERPFSQSEIRDFCIMLFGVDLLPSTVSSCSNRWWDSFCEAVESWQKHEECQFHPYHKAMKSWIDTAVLKKIFSSEDDHSQSHSDGDSLGCNPSTREPAVQTR